MNNRSKIKTASLLLFLFLTLSFFAYANEAFDELESAITNRCNKIIMEKLHKKYAGKRIEGRGYIVSITEDVSKGVVVTLSNDKDPASASAVYIIVYVREFIAKDVLQLKPGRYSRFFGDFDEVRMRSIIVRNAFVK
jgi:hypothetical protein